MRVTNEYVFFYGNQEPYSNHYLCGFEENGIKFNCVEQYMMYHKAMLFGDVGVAYKILNETSPNLQKKLGRVVNNFSQIKWDISKYDIVYNGCKLKFSIPELKEELLKYKGKNFVEASGYDKIWGVGLSEKDDKILNPDNWRGQNLLGKILTRLSQKL